MMWLNLLCFLMNGFFYLFGLICIEIGIVFVIDMLRLFGRYVYNGKHITICMPFIGTIF